MLFAAALSLFLFGVAPLHMASAQGLTGQISVTVRDPSGQAAAGVDVTLINSQSGRTATGARAEALLLVPETAFDIVTEGLTLNAPGVNI
jgi:hypothetical protein